MSAPKTWTRRPYPGTCDTCRIYWNTLQDLGEEWAAAASADEPPISGQIRRATVMYLEHVMQHLGPKEAS